MVQVQPAHLFEGHIWIQQLLLLFVVLQFEPLYTPGITPGVALRATLPRLSESH